MKDLKHIRRFNESDQKSNISDVSKSYSVNEFFGGTLKEMMSPRVQQLIDYLEDYKENINKENSLINDEDTRKIENMWNYIIQNIDLDTISLSNRQGKKVRGEGEKLSQRMKRSVKNF